MKLLKWLFSVTSSSKKYKPEILLIAYLIAILLIEIIIENVFYVDNIFTTISCYFILIQWIVLIFPCIIRLYDISDYNEKNKIKDGTKKFKFEPVLYSIVDVKKWLLNSKEPDLIYVKGKDGKIIIIEVSFGTKGKNGPFINKGIFIDDVEISSEKIDEVIFDKCDIKDNCISIVAITENNDPKYFSLILEDIK